MIKKPGVAKKELADIILSMTYNEIMDIAREFEDRQREEECDGFEWDLKYAHGNYGIAVFLTSWAEAQEE